MPHKAFVRLCAAQSMVNLQQQHWAGGGSVAQRYLAAYGAGRVQGGRARVQQWLLHLTEALLSARLGAGVEACMQLRAECLSLHAMRSSARPRETTFPSLEPQNGIDRLAGAIHQRCLRPPAHRPAAACWRHCCTVWL
jgi:hypothetical protein